MSSQTNGKATIFDVASKAGVSIKTVSRVVNNEPNVRDKTREKVQAAIEALDYRPNAAARGLSSKRSYVIALIYENPEEFSYMKHVLNGVLKACERSGYTLLLRPVAVTNEQLLPQVREFLAETPIAAVILPAPMGDFPGLAAALNETGVPFATITPRNAEVGAISVACDDETAMRELTDFLLDKGHERIGFIKGHPDHVASEKRLAGYRRALRDRKIAFDRTLVRQGYFDFHSGRKAAAALLDLKDPPTAILASNDDMAAGVMFEVRERGLDVPGDVALAGFDDTPVASRMWPRLTTAKQPIEAMAEALVDRLIDLVSGNEPEPLTTFACEIVIRDSA